MKKKTEYFTDLIVWQQGHNLVLEIYSITKFFPHDEKFALVDQMRRASTSITSNIAEGFGRLYAKDKQRFYEIAKGSLIELQNQILLSRDLGYINSNTYLILFEKSESIYKLLNKLLYVNKSKIV